MVLVLQWCLCDYTRCLQELNQCQCGACSNPAYTIVCSRSRCSHHTFALHLHTVHQSVQTSHALQVINSAAKSWGLECLRYEIRDIVPPPGIVRAMELQAEAERRKRAQVLESEGVRQATINESEARRVRFVLACLPKNLPHPCLQGVLPTYTVWL
jgi:hypothetical protein